MDDEHNEWMRINHSMKLGLGSLLFTRSAPETLGSTELSLLSAGIQEHSLNLEMTENCDGSVTFVYEDFDTCIPERPLFPQDDFIRREKWWADVNWDELPKKRYR